MGRNLFSVFLSRLYHSTLLRVFIAVVFVLAVLTCTAYYTLVLPRINRAISQQYLQQTGHQLQHDKIDVQLFKCNLNLRHLKDSSNLWQADSVSVNMACLQSFHERNVIINSINIQKLNVNIHQLENEQWNFNDILTHQQKIRAATHEKPTEKAIPLVIKKMTVVNSALHSNVLVLNNLMLDAASLNFSMSNIDFRKYDLSGFSLKAELNKSTQLTLAGKINLASLSGELDVDALHIPLVWFNGALQPYVAMDILSGTVDVHNHINVVAGLPQRIMSNGALNDLKIRPTATEQDAVKWKSLQWEQADIGIIEKSVHVPLVTLNNLDGQFIIDKNRKTNVQSMFVSSGQTDQQQQQKQSEPQENIQEREQSTQPQQQIQTNPAYVSTKPAVEKKSWQFSVDRMAINKAAIGFYDQSLTPSFTVIIQEFTGDIVNISSDENVFATINMVGNVDGYSPVTLNGKANLLNKSPTVDALLAFKHLDMGALSTYSAEYAGWRINKGLLSADLNYHYEGGRVLGKNHVVIDHLEFGEKVRGAHVIDIPLRLGLALLTDQHGVAVLDTEISGLPSDPQFKFREIILRALSNTLKKILTAPFRFLSNLVNTKEDLGNIQFTAGESQLSDIAKEKLRLLTEAMQKRPKMRLSIQGLYDQNNDLVALKEEQVKSDLQKSGVSVDALASHNEAWNSAVAKKYQLLIPTGSSVNIDEKYQELIAKEIVDPERLHKLAHERAQAVKQYFVIQLAVPSETILVDSEANCEKAGNCSSSEVIFTLEI